MTHPTSLIEEPTMKPLAVLTTAVVLAGLLFFGRASQEKPQARAATGEGAAAPTWFKVVFGVDQKDAVNELL